MTGAKNEKILEAALDLFIRHGFRRTTMGDIAEAAEMSRPSVYLLYANKQEVFRAVVLRHIEQARELGREKISSVARLEDKLSAALEVWVVEPYRMISRSSQAQELYELGYSFAADLRVKAVQQFEQQLAEAIRSCPELNKPALAKLGLSVDSIAHALSRSTLELKRAARNLRELNAILATIVRIHGHALTAARSG